MQNANDSYFSKTEARRTGQKRTPARILTRRKMWQKSDSSVAADWYADGAYTCSNT